MKVFAIGGSGLFGTPAMEIMAKVDLVTEITIAGRNLERAQQAAAAVGPKANAVQVEASDLNRLESLLPGYDILVNLVSAASTFRDLLIQACIRTTTHYCDITAGPPVPKELATTVKDAGITAIYAHGFGCGLTNLLSKHAADQLDTVEEVVGGLNLGVFLDYDYYFNVDHLNDLLPRGSRATELSSVLASPVSVQEKLQVIEDARAIEFCLRAIWHKTPFVGDGETSVSTYRNKARVTIDAQVEGIEIACSDTENLTLHAITPSDRIDDLPALPGIKQVALIFSCFSPRLDQLLREQAGNLSSGEPDFETVERSIYQAIEQDPENYLIEPNVADKMPIFSFSAFGRKDERYVRSFAWITKELCSKTNNMHLAGVDLACGVTHILRGDMKKRGVFKAEEVYELESFVEGYSQLLPTLPTNGKIFEQRLDFLS